MSFPLRRRMRRSAAVLAVSLAALSLPMASTAHAGTPPSTPDSTPPSTPVAPSDGSGETTTTDPATGQTVEIVQSWTLTAGGGPDGSEPGSRPDLTYQVAPGAVISDTVVVFNLGNVTMDFKVYATDAFNNADGQFDLIPSAEVPTDAGAWVDLVQEDITLPPGKQATIPFTLTVPLDATPGDHVGAIVAANIATADNGDGQVVDVERRTGTRLYVQVDGPVQPELAITDLEMSYGHAANPLGGTADVSFTVENRGNVRLGGTPVVEVGGPFGLFASTITLDEIPELLPGEQIQFTTTLDDVPALFLDSTKVRIETNDPAQRADVDDVEGRARSFVPPISVLLVVLLIALVFLARRAYLRRRTAALPVAPIARREVDPADHDDVREPQHQ